ncbi:flagellar hook-length control protein FliK [Pseudoalteromonas luteoviolacea]|uniref:flagellar hook-length control protein FliK n=1 Tax=Pseudoalteromonas luteoviolacea TaxID=43657 RepID=UPI001153DAD5|nr:flagellar hook-length control protein FliK [Pseudoalteromonas luteoviolacea]TQF69960.1 flagellar hook-length control protein FliK [Pseudoalteromonas luteoviolacea]
MNKQTIPVQSQVNVSTTTFSSQDSNTQAILEADKTFLARNIVIKPDSIQMEVALEGRWQPIRLSSQANIEQPLKLAEAQLKLDATGTVLTLATPEAKLTLNSAQSLLSLLSLLKGFGDHSALQTEALIKPQSNTQLTLPKLGINMPVPAGIGSLLKQEEKLVASLGSKGDKIQIQLFNMFGDKLHQMPIAKKAIAQLITQLSQQTANYVQLSQQKGVLKLGRHQHQISQLQSNTPSQLNQLQQQAWHPVKIHGKPDGIEVAISTKTTAIKLATSIKNILPKLDTQPFQAQLDRASKQHSEPTLSYNKPLFKVSLADIKQTVKSALQAIVEKPFFNRAAATTTRPDSGKRNIAIPDIQPNKTNYLHLPLVSKAAQRPANSPLMALAQGIQQNFASAQMQTPPSTAQTSTPDAPNMTTKPESMMTQPKEKAAPGSHTSSPPQVQTQTKLTFEARLALVQQVMTAALPKDAKPYAAEHLNLTKSKLIDQPTQKGAIPGPVKELMSQDSAESKRLPAIALPLAHILSKPLRAIALADTSTDTLKNATLLSEKIADKQSFKSPQSADLTRLVHQAFSRLIDENKSTAQEVSQDLFTRLPSIATPLNTSVPVSSFTQALDKLLVTLLGTQLTAQTDAQLPKNVSQEQRVASMVEAIFPGNKLQQPKQFIQAVNLSAQQSLMEDLSFIQNSMSATSQGQALGQKFDSDSQLLINLFLPMKTPPECRQSELQIGQYKKPAKAGMPEKQVWFVRLNFDYEALGQLSVQAELMDKAVDCEIIGNSASVCQLAQPHLDALRSKLAAHGLQVGEIELKEDALQVKQFYDKHAIVNIKV